MFDKPAIQQIQESQTAHVVQDNILRALTSEGVLALPDSVATKDLEAYMPTRRRQRGNFRTSDKASFASYVQEHKEHGATVFIDADHMIAAGILNLGTKDTPGHCDNRAVLALQKTAGYFSLINLCSRSIQTQRDLAEFLEDWASNLFCLDEAGNTIEPKKAIAAVRKLTVESMHKVESAQNSLSASRSTFEQVNATSTDPIPVRIVFSCEPYFGLSARAIAVRVSVLTSGKDPAFTCRIVNESALGEEIAQEFAELVKASLTDTPVAIGTYESK